MDPIEEAARLLAKAEHAVALTGAGVSTASGIPDFRGPHGLWRRIPPWKFTIDYFYENPLEVWRLYKTLYQTLKHARPNPAHKALATLEKEGIIKTIITQNIDGLHQKAGSKNVIELHGTATRARCTVCGHTIPIEQALASLNHTPPRCPRCQGLLKPDIVFFGEPLPTQALHKAIQEATRADVMLVAGTSLQVSPANQLPIIAKNRGAKIIIVNLQPTPQDHTADIVIHAPVEQTLPAICRKILERRTNNRSGTLKEH